MTIQISRKCEYAIKAMVHVAGLKEGELYTAKTISTSADIPLKFLEKILQALVGHDLLLVTYGPRGGYRLARESMRISFRDIIEAVEGPMRLNLCVGDEPRCSGLDCSMKNQWERLQGEIEQIFQKTTLAHAARPLVRAK